MSDEQQRPEEDRRVLKERRRRRTRVIVLVAIVVIMALLGLDNGHEVPVDYLVGDTEARLVWVIIVSFLAGAVFERAYTFLRGRRRDDG